jgi:hypothetical protein
MKIVAFYTPSYRQIVQGLLDSVEKFGYDIHVEEVEDRGTWEENCGQKPEVIYRCMQEYKDDILYLDADAVINRELPMKDLTGEKIKFYVFSWKDKNKKDKIVNELLSGTLFIPYNKENLEIVKKWKAHQINNPMIWDQQTLGEVLNKMKNYFFLTLSAEWCYIERYHKEHVDNPIIIHGQASRIMK